MSSRFEGPSERSRPLILLKSIQKSRRTINRERRSWSREKSRFLEEGRDFQKCRSHSVSRRSSIRARETASRFDCPQLLRTSANRHFHWSIFFYIIRCFQMMYKKSTALLFLVFKAFSLLFPQRLIKYSYVITRIIKMGNFMWEFHE